MLTGGRPFLVLGLAVGLATLSGIAALLARAETPGAWVAALGAAVGTLAGAWLKPIVDREVGRQLERRQAADERHLRRGSSREVREWHARALGVHPSISTPRGADAGHTEATDLPTYVPRDFDDRLLSAIIDAGSQGGFILLIGPPFSGKTRCAYEAVQAALPRHKLLYPESPADIFDYRGNAKDNVIWLDDLDRFLVGGDAINALLIRRLTMPDSRNVIIGTIWHTRYEQLHQPSRPGDALDSPSRETAYQVLRAALAFAVPANFSPGERDRASLLAADDGRLAVALESREHSVTQVLAAAPQLERHWQQAEPSAAAIIDAAVECRRAGYEGALSAETLAVVAEELLRPQGRNLDLDWFEKGLKYALEPLQANTSVLRHVADTGGGSGYVVADYLLHVAARSRAMQPIPNVVWKAVQGAADDPTALHDLGLSAQSRLKLKVAEDSFRRAISKGHPTAWVDLVRLLEDQDRAEDLEVVLREAVENGRLGAHERLAVFYQRQNRSVEVGDVLEDALRRGELSSLWLRDYLLLENIDAERLEREYRKAMRAGHVGAWRVLVYLLQRLSRHEEALTVLEEAAAAGEQDAWWPLALTKAQDPQLFEEALRAAMEAGRPGAWEELANLLLEQRRVSEAEELLMRAVSLGLAGAAEDYLSLLEATGRTAEATRLRKEGL